MLQFKNGKFLLCGVSFAIPNDFYLEYIPEADRDEGILLMSPDKKITFGLYIDHECDNIEEDFQELFYEGSCMFQESEICPTARNGLPGLAVSYGDAYSRYYESRFPLESKGVLVAIAWCKKGMVENLPMHPDVQAVLNTISEV